MDENVVLKVSDVSKKFSRNLKSLMKYGIYDIGRNVLGMNVDSSKLRKDEFWAVDDVSFELHRGDTLGIIGPNGSGKSTVLKMLNGIYMPDKGTIEIKGKVGALIEVGAGFHPLLTGWENIYVNGAILGMSTKDIDEKFDDIVAFADIGDFLDSPVKNYSSGMYVRLGFAIAVHTEPDILLVDEILSVGDVGFRAKSMEKIKSLKEKGASIVFVSHDISTVVRVCDRVMCLQYGKNIYIGEPEKALEFYNSTSINKANLSGKYSIQTKQKSIINKIEIRDYQNHIVNSIESGNCIKVLIYYSTSEKILNPNFIVSIKSQNGLLHTGASTFYDAYYIDCIEGNGIIGIIFKELILGAGDYFLNVSLLDKDNFTIKEQDLNISPFKVKTSKKVIGMLELKHVWIHEK